MNLGSCDVVGRFAGSVLNKSVARSRAQVIFGPLFVFIAFNERPSVWTLLGGCCLLAVLATHEIFSGWLWHAAARSEQQAQDVPTEDRKSARHVEGDLSTEATSTSSLALEVATGGRKRKLVGSWEMKNSVGMACSRCRTHGAHAVAAFLDQALSDGGLDRLPEMS